MKTIYQIKKVKDGTFTTRIVTANGKLTFSNHDVNGKQAAYKNLATNIKAIARSINVSILSVNKVRNENKLTITKWVDGREKAVTVIVKEINC
jgi:uncharacterized protein YegP (UPF0339 family)